MPPPPKLRLAHTPTPLFRLADSVAFELLLANVEAADDQATKPAKWATVLAGPLGREA